MYNEPLTQTRIKTLIAKLEKGHQKTNELLSALTADGWHQPVFPQPHTWTFRDLLAHFVSSEERLLQIAQDVAQGGPGIGAGFDFDVFNVQEQQRLKDRTPHELITALDMSRQITLDWLLTLDESQLDRRGMHPVLGETTLEAMIAAIYAHQLLHMREVKPMLNQA